jgi:hypothetical protein
MQVRPRSLVARVAATVTWIVAGSLVCLAQDYTDSLFGQSRLGAAGRRGEAAPHLDFKLVRDIALPGPLPPASPRLVDGRIAIPVSGGLAVTDWSDDAAPEVLPMPEDGPDDAVAEEWSADPTGRYRARHLDTGRLVMQKRCSIWCKGWNKVWKARVPGTDLALPLLTRKAVFVGAGDNRVYALRKRSGNRVWAVDVGGRPTRPLVLWNGALNLADGGLDPAEVIDLQALLVLLESGSELIALGTLDGSIIARFELAEAAGHLKGVPLTTPDGKIVVARERYNAAEASLMVFELSAARPATAEGASPVPVVAPPPPPPLFW